MALQQQPMWPRLRAWLAAGLLAAALPVGAVPLVYSEAVDGDLPESNGWPLLALDVGSNTVSGSQFFASLNNQVTADFDSFRFLVPVGQKLVSVSFASQRTDTTGLVLPQLYLDTFIDTFPAIQVMAHEQVNLLNPSSPLSGSFAAGMPLGAGDYLLFEGQVGSLFAWGQYVSWDYTWTLVVENDLPEPASLGLVALGLGALPLARRRRRS